MYLGIANHNMKEFNVKGELVNTEYVSEYLVSENKFSEKQITDFKNYYYNMQDIVPVINICNNLYLYINFIKVKDGNIQIYEESILFL